MVREAVARLLPGTRWRGTVAVGSWWPRSNRPQIDLVGVDRGPVAKEVHFVGTIKWRERSPLSGGDAADLARDAKAVPSMTLQTPLVAVSRSGVEATGLAQVWNPDDLLAAWQL